MLALGGWLLTLVPPVSVYANPYALVAQDDAADPPITASALPDWAKPVLVAGATVEESPEEPPTVRDLRLALEPQATSAEAAGALAALLKVEGEDWLRPSCFSHRCFADRYKEKRAAFLRELGLEHWSQLTREQGKLLIAARAHWSRVGQAALQDIARPPGGWPMPELEPPWWNPKIKKAVRFARRHTYEPAKQYLIAEAERARGECEGMPGMQRLWCKAEAALADGINSIAFGTVEGAGDAGELALDLTSHPKVQKEFARGVVDTDWAAVGTTAVTGTFATAEAILVDPLAACASAGANCVAALEEAGSAAGAVGRRVRSVPGAVAAAGEFVRQKGRKGFGGNGSQSTALALAKGVAKASLCFAAGTPVHTVHGLKAIEQVQVDDEVWTRHEVTGELVPGRVVRTFVTPNQEILRLTLWNPTRGEEVVRTTAEHPFFVEGVGQTRAEQLSVGDRLEGLDGITLVTDKRWEQERATVYNFEVEHHTYFVGELGVWVHNRCLATRDRRSGITYREEENGGLVTVVREDFRNRDSGEGGVVAAMYPEGQHPMPDDRFLDFKVDGRTVRVLKEDGMPEIDPDMLAHNWQEEVAGANLRASQAHFNAVAFDRDRGRRSSFTNTGQGLTMRIENERAEWVRYFDDRQGQLGDKAIGSNAEFVAFRAERDKALDDFDTAFTNLRTEINNWAGNPGVSYATSPNASDALRRLDQAAIGARADMFTAEIDRRLARLRAQHARNQQVAAIEAQGGLLILGTRSRRAAAIEEANQTREEARERADEAYQARIGGISDEQQRIRETLLQIRRGEPRVLGQDVRVEVTHLHGDGTVDVIWKGDEQLRNFRVPAHYTRDAPERSAAGSAEIWDVDAEGFSAGQGRSRPRIIEVNNGEPVLVPGMGNGLQPARVVEIRADDTAVVSYMSPLHTEERRVVSVFDLIPLIQ